MRARFDLVALAAMMCLGGCSHDYIPSPLDVRLIGAVIGEIKEQVGIYQATVQSERPAPGAPLPPAPSGMLCGHGLVDFDIVAVSATLTTKVAVTTSADLKLTLPLDPSATSTLTPSGNGKEVTTNSQVLTFSAYPILPVTFEVARNEDIAKRPVAFTLLSLRNALREAAYKHPCFSTIHDAEKDQDDTFVLGFDIVKTLGGGIALKLMVLDASYSRTREITQGNTITVSFRPYMPLVDIKPKPRTVRPGGENSPVGTFGGGLPPKLGRLILPNGRRDRAPDPVLPRTPGPEI